MDNRSRQIGLKKSANACPAFVSSRDSIPLEALLPDRIGKFNFNQDGWKIQKKLILKTNVGRETSLSRLLTCFQDPGPDIEPNVHAFCPDEWDKKRQSPKMNKLVIIVEYREGMCPRSERQMIAKIVASYYGPEQYGYEGRLVLNGGWRKLAETLQPMVMKKGASLPPLVVKLEEAARKFVKEEGKEIKGWEMHPKTWAKIMDGYATLTMLAGGRVFSDESELVLKQKNQTILHNNRMKAILDMLKTEKAKKMPWTNTYEVELEQGVVYVLFKDDTAKIETVSREPDQPEGGSSLKFNVKQKLFALDLPMILNESAKKGKIKPLYTKISRREDPIEMGDMDLINLDVLKRNLAEQEKKRLQREENQAGSQYLEGDVRITRRQVD